MFCTLIDHRNDVKFAKVRLFPGLFTVDCKGVRERRAAKTRETKAPSLTRVVICVSRAFVRQTKKKERLLVVWSTVTSTQIPNHETTKKRCHENKQHNKKAKTEEAERNCKIFANSVFLNPGKDIYGHVGMFSLADIL